MPTAALTALSLIALLLAIGAVVLATIANRRWATRPRAVAAEPGQVPQVADRGRSDASERAALEALAARLQELGTHVTDLHKRLVEVRSELDQARGELRDVRAATAEPPAPDPTALRHVALVRYDAFADVGGRLSYSVALLDDTRSGLVLTTLSGKADVRTYVRPISAGAAEGTLTAEEQQAIDAAVGRDA